MSTRMFELDPVHIPNMSGKTVFVTGAGVGIGAELVRLLISHGAKVYAGVQKQQKIELLPETARVLFCDITCQAEIDSAVAVVAEEEGKLDALVNNAGVIDPIGPYASVTGDSLIEALIVNVVGAHRLTVAALPLLRISGGTVVNAGTGAASTPMEGWTAYCSSKASLQMLTQMAAIELAKDGIKVFFLGIPPTNTAMQDKIRSSGLNAISRIPKHELVPADVPSSCMAWLCGDEAKQLDQVLLDVRKDPFAAMMKSQKKT